MPDGIARWDPESLRMLAVDIGLRAVAKLRSIFSLASYSEVVRGDTLRADVELEDYVLRLMRSRGFRGTIVTEEAGVVELGNDEVVAVLDPLDGSTNFAVGIPWFGVSVAFAIERSNQVHLDDVVAGAVVPFHDGRPISFAKGRGVFVGTSKVSPRSKEGRIIYVAFYGEDPEALRTYERIHSELTRAGWSVKSRSLGSVALELAYVALRRIDLFVDIRARLRNVDVAAALGILKESGGLFFDADGKPLVVPLDGVRPVESLVASSSSELLSIALKAKDDRG